MSSNERTYDDETEQRRVRPRDARPTYLQFIDDSFWALGEMVVMGFPSLALFFIATSFPLQNGGVIGFFATWLSIAVFRGDWLPTGRPWPDASLGTVLLRIVHYNVGLFGAAVAGRWALTQTGSMGALAAVTIIVSILGVGSLSWTSALLGE